MKIDLIFNHSVTQISTKPTTEYLNIHNVCLRSIDCNKTAILFISVKKEGSNAIKVR